MFSSFCAFEGADKELAGRGAVDAAEQDTSD